MLGWRQKHPTTPIYGPDGRPIEEWLADQKNATVSEDAPRPKYDTATGRRILGYDPHTGVPILEQPPKPPGLLDRWAWWNRQSAQAQRVLKIRGGALVAILLVVLAATIGGGGRRAGTEAAAATAVPASPG